MLNSLLTLAGIGALALWALGPGGWIALVAAIVLLWAALAL